MFNSHTINHYIEAPTVRAIPGKNLNVLEMVLSIQAEVMNKKKKLYCKISILIILTQPLVFQRAI